MAHTKRTAALLLVVVCLAAGAQAQLGAALPSLPAGGSAADVTAAVQAAATAIADKEQAKISGLQAKVSGLPGAGLLDKKLALDKSLISGVEDKISGKISGLKPLAGLAKLGGGLPSISGLKNVTVSGLGKGYISGKAALTDALANAASQVPLVGGALESTVNGIASIQEGQAAVLGAAFGTFEPLLKQAYAPVNKAVTGASAIAAKNKVVRSVLLSAALAHSVKKQKAAFDYAVTKLKWLAAQPSLKDSELVQESLALAEGLQAARDALVAGAEDAVRSSALFRPAVNIVDALAEAWERVTSRAADAARRVVDTNADLAGAAIDGVTGAVDNARDAAKAVTGAVKRAAEKTEADAGP